MINGLRFKDFDFARSRQQWLSRGPTASFAPQLGSFVLGLMAGVLLLRLRT